MSSGAFINGFRRVYRLTCLLTVYWQFMLLNDSYELLRDAKCGGICLVSVLLPAEVFIGAKMGTNPG